MMSACDEVACVFVAGEWLGFQRLGRDDSVCDEVACVFLTGEWLGLEGLGGDDPRATSSAGVLILRQRRRLRLVVERAIRIPAIPTDASSSVAAATAAFWSVAFVIVFDGSDAIARVTESESERIGRSFHSLCVVDCGGRSSGSSRVWGA